MFSTSFFAFVLLCAFVLPISWWFSFVFFFCPFRTDSRCLRARLLPFTLIVRRPDAHLKTFSSASAVDSRHGRPPVRWSTYISSDSRNGDVRMRLVRRQSCAISPSIPSVFSFARPDLAQQSLVLHVWLVESGKTSWITRWSSWVRNVWTSLSERKWKVSPPPVSLSSSSSSSQTPKRPRRILQTRLAFHTRITALLYQLRGMPI